jgi:hypothetical protein
MRFVSGVSGQKFWHIVNSHVINTALHWAKQVMVQMGNMDGLVNDQVINFARHRVVVSDDPANRLILSRAKGWVIARYRDWTVMV